MAERPRILASHSSSPVDTDCACPATTVSLAPAALPAQTALWNASPDIYRIQLPGDYQLMFSPSRYAPMAVLNSSAVALLEWFGTPRSLQERAPFQDATGTDWNAAIAQLAALGLIRPAGTAMQPVESQPETLTAWFHMTGACSLNCRYCYVTQTNEFMDAATGLAAVEAVFRSAERHGFKQVVLKYAGGEATLCFTLITRLHRHAARLSGETGIALHEVILSNGVGLPRSMIEAMQALNLRLVISLDGLGAAHDQQRVFHDGRGSSAYVVQSIENALAWGVRPDLSITVTEASADTLRTTVAFALERGLRFNLNLYRQHPQAPRALRITNHQRVIDGIRSALDLIEDWLPRQRLIDGLLDLGSFAHAHTHACGAGRSYLVIDQRGRIAACQMEMAKAVTDVQADDPLQHIISDSAGFLNVPVAQKHGCRDCAWRYWCAGGCPLFTFCMNDRADVPSPYCDIYAAVYPALLRLEGLRLLKWHRSA